MENTPKAQTLSECIVELDNIRSILSEIVDLFRMASKDGNPDTFEATELERLAYGSTAFREVIHIPHKKRGRKPRVILRPDKAAEFLGVSTATIYRWQNTLPGFPKRIALGSRASGWFKSDLEAWLASRKNEVAA